MRYTEVAYTIKVQLGAIALMMMGAENLVAVPNCDEHMGGLAFQLGDFSEIGGTKNDINAIRITLSFLDTYNVEFLKLSDDKVTPEVVSVYNDVYVDMLHNLIESETGLIVRM